MSSLAITVGAVLLVSIGWNVAALTRLASPVGALLAAYVAGWAAIAAIVVTASLVGRIDAPTLLVVGAVAAVLALVARRVLAPDAHLSARAVAARAGHAFATPQARVLAGALGVATAYLAVLGLAFPPNDWDALTYHLTRAALWIQEGHVGYLDVGNELRLDVNPPLAEMGTAALLALGGGDRYTTLLPLAALGAAALGTAGLARRAGLTHGESAFAGLVFATLPIVLLHGQAVMSDLVVASMLVAAIYFLLGTAWMEGLLGAVALGLALETKFTAVLALPVVALVVLAGRTRDRVRTVGWLALGVALGAPWYVLNLFHTGHADGGLGADADQIAERSFSSIVSTFRALAVDLLDLSGLQGRGFVAYLVAGMSLIVVGVVVGAHRGDAGLRRSTIGAGAIVIAVPIVIMAASTPLLRVWWKAFHAVGRPDVARSAPSNWDVSLVSDTALSGYGPIGLVAACSAVAVALALARRAGVSRRLAWVYAATPFALMLVLSLTIVWDPWRQRLEMFALVPPVALLGLSLRARWASWAVVGLAVPTMVLVLAVPFTKPSGLGVLDSRRSVWGRDRIDVQTSLRTYDGTPALLRAVERLVPADATMAAAVPVDTFLAPLLGRRYDRTLRLVADGSGVPDDAAWLVVGKGAHPVLRAGAWTTVFADAENSWKLLRRVEP